MFRAAIDSDPKLQVMECWKSFSVPDAITFITPAIDELKLETVNVCCKDLWSEAVNEFKGFPAIDGEVKKIIQTTREVRGEGFVNMIDEEVEEHVDEYQKMLTNEELEDIVKSSTEQ
jgi:hypothetical protein